PAIVYVTVAALYLVGAALIAVIRDGRSAREREDDTPASLFSGVVFIWSRRLLRGLISLDLVAVLLGGATALLPIYARDILGTGPWGLGLLRAAPAIGALVSSVVLARRPVQHGAGPIFFGAVLVFGVATIVFGVSTNLLVSLAALTVLGGADLLSVVIRHSLVQMRTPDGMRGRVSAVHSVSTNTSNQLGEFEAGVLAALLGPLPAVVVGGVGADGGPLVPALGELRRGLDERGERGLGGREILLLHRRDASGQDRVEVGITGAVPHVPQHRGGARGRYRILAPQGAERVTLRHTA